MNKNIVLLGLGAIALVLVGALFLFSPQKEHVSLTQPLSSQTSKNRENIDITYQKENPKTGDNKSSKHQDIKSKPKPKKIDPSIKATTIDHYNTYLIQLIDKNPEDKDLKIENKPGSYVYVEGKVDGKEYVLKVPKAVATRPGIKLKITNLKTKKSIELDASFLSESASLPIGSTYRANIDTHNPNNIQTDIELPEENPAFPTFRE